MSTHYVVVESVSGLTSETAVLEVSTPSTATVSVTLRNASGTQLGALQMATNADNYAVSQNVFSLTAQQTTIAIVSSSVATSVSMRHTEGGTTAVTRAVTVPKTEEARSTMLMFPTGTIGTTAHAMVSHSNGMAIDVVLRYGTLASSPVSTTTIAPGGYALIPITNDNSNAILSSGSEFHAQYLVNLRNAPFIESYLLP